MLHSVRVQNCNCNCHVMKKTERTKSRHVFENEKWWLVSRLSAFFYLVRALKLNSRGITQTRALILNTLVLFSLETTSLLYGMSINKITDCNKAHAHVCLLVLYLTSLSIPSVHSPSLSLILFFSQWLPLSGNITMADRRLTLARMQHSESLLPNFDQTERSLSPRAVLGLRCTAWAVFAA